ncbi:exosome complex RNA-binding protein Csl4 [Candidatus Micrarchaeota archaeon]|nr:exosome complex RNA-binding protein Csl4 [Candidatus Micrarchaeota archaeon]
MIDLSIPGDQLAIVEEFQPGFGAFEEEGIVYASIPGTAKMENAVAKVENQKAVRALARGDLVYSIVRNVYDQVALLEFQSVPYRAATNTYAYMRIAHVQRGFTEHFRDVFRIGDFVRARVHEVKPLGIYLTMADADLGVVRAFCASCRHELPVTKRDLTCKNCGRRQQRKIALKTNSR